MVPAKQKKQLAKTEIISKPKSNGKGKGKGKGKLQVNVPVSPKVNIKIGAKGDNNFAAGDTTHQAANGKAIMKAIRRLVLALSGIESIDDLETWMKDSGVIAEGGEDITQLKEFLDRMSKVLRAKNGKHSESQGTRETLSGMEDFFLFRDEGHTMTLLAPVELPFKLGCNIKKKVFGCIRRHGAYFPLICSISGSSAPANNLIHPKLLDSAVWTEQVHRLGTFFRHRFRCDGFDEYHGHPKGTSYASHVEPKLMLWYACRLFTKLTGGEPLPLDEQVDMLPGGLKLLIGTTKPKAEVLVSRKPCTDCEKFQQLMTRKTGIEFKFIILANLGKLREGKDQKGYHTYLSPEEDGEEAENGEILPRLLKSSSFEIVINQKHKDTNVASTSYVKKTKGQKSPANIVLHRKSDHEFFIEGHDVDIQVAKKKSTTISAKGMREAKISDSRGLSQKRMRDSIIEEDEYVLPNSSAVEISRHFPSKKKLRTRNRLQTPASSSPDPSVAEITYAPGSPISIDSDSSSDIGFKVGRERGRT